MSLLEILKIAIAVATIATGLIALWRPRSVTGFTGLEPRGVRGISEIRAVLGGLFIGAGLAPLIYAVPAAYRMLGLIYLAIGIARAFSIVYDRSTERSNLISLAVEAVFGLVLLI